MTSTHLTRKISIDNDKLWKTEIITPITSQQNVNTGAQGDCLYLPVISMIANRTSYDGTNDKNEYLEHRNDSCGRSNVASHKDKQNSLGFSTSSATFIVSSAPLVEIMIGQDDHDTKHMIDSNSNIKLHKLSRTFHDHQHPRWIKQHWLSIIVITGITLIFITVIAITTIIIH